MMEINKLLKELADLTGYELKKKVKENLRAYIDPITDDKYKDISIGEMIDKLNRLTNVIKDKELENRAIKNTVATYLNSNVNKSSIIKKFMNTPRIQERLIIEDNQLIKMREEMHLIQLILDKKETKQIFDNLNIKEVISAKLDRMRSDDVIIIKKSSKAI